MADFLWMNLTEASDVVTISLSNGSRLFTVCVCECEWVSGWVGMTDYPSLPQIARLPFQFPYYGHLVNTVAVTTGGTYSFPE